MSNNIVKTILDRLDISDTGTYDNHFYVIDLADSNEYAKTYTKLDKYAINTEYPAFGVNSNDTTVKVTNYFELDENNETYLIFLIADFAEDRYYLKIGGF